MSELSDSRLLLAAGVDSRSDIDVGDTTHQNVEPEYQNVSCLVPSTQTAATSPATAGKCRSKFVKKPKPGPKPNYVAVKVAELNQKINSNETSSKLSLTKPAQREWSGRTTPVRPVAAVEDQSSRSTNSHLTQNFVSSSDHHLYDTAVRVDVDVLYRVSEDTAAASGDDVRDKSSSSSSSSSVRTSAATTTTTTTTPAASAAVYDDDDDPIYDNAIDVVVARQLVAAAAAADSDSDVTEESTYDEAVAVQTRRLQTSSYQHHELDEESTTEPVYAEPDEICSLYDQAQPVNMQSRDHS